MSGQSFSFPPPPPPPPPRRTEHTDTFSSRGRGRGRGGFEHPRGRGSYSSGRARGSHGARERGGFTGHPGQRHSPVVPAVQGRHPTSAATSSFTPAHYTAKRDHSTAFDQDQARNSFKPKAPPAVPSFMADLANLLPPKPPTPSVVQKGTASSGKSKNALGLTPAAAHASDSEDDDGEEARLATTSTELELEFSYRGQTAALRTPAEIAAWIAERKRRYPTQAKREAAKKEADEKRKKWEAEKQARADALRATKQFRQQRIKGQDQREPARDNAALAAARLHAEKLRRRALKAQRDLEAAEAALRNGTAVAADGPIASDDDSIGTVSDSSELGSENDSSSSESDTDNDAPPEQQSSKVEVKSAFADPGQRARHVKKRCNAFLKTGRCRYGSSCVYSHEPSSRVTTAKTSPNQQKPARKGLFQVMVEKEQEQERRRVLSAIISIGKQGLLEEPS